MITFYESIFQLGLVSPYVCYQREYKKINSISFSAHYFFYCNDLNFTKVLDFDLFADDTNIYYASDNLIKLEKRYVLYSTFG